MFTAFRAKCANVVQAAFVDIVASHLHRVVMSQVELIHAVTTLWRTVASMAVTY